MGWPGKQEAEIDGGSLDVEAAREVFGAAAPGRGRARKGSKGNGKRGGRPGTSEKQRRSEAAAVARAEAMAAAREKGVHAGDAQLGSVPRGWGESAISQGSTAAASRTVAVEASVQADSGRTPRREWFEGRHARLDAAGYVAGASVARPGVLERTRNALESLRAVAETGQPVVSMADGATGGQGISEADRMAGMTPLERATRRVEKMLLEQGVVRASLGGVASGSRDSEPASLQRPTASGAPRGSVARARAAFEGQGGAAAREGKFPAQPPPRRLSKEQSSVGGAGKGPARVAMENKKGPYLASFLPPADILSDAAIDVEYIYVDASRFLACNEGGQPSAAAGAALRKAASERVARGEWGTKEGHASILDLLAVPGGAGARRTSLVDSPRQSPLGARIDALRVDVDMATAVGVPSPRDGLYSTIRELSARADALCAECALCGSREDTAVAESCVVDLAKFASEVARFEASFCRQHLRSAFCLVELAGRTREDPSAGTTPFVSLVLASRAATLMTQGGAQASAAAVALSQEIRANPAALARDAADLRRRCVDRLIATPAHHIDMLRLMLSACKGLMCEYHASDAAARRMDLLDRKNSAHRPSLDVACLEKCSLQCRLQHETRCQLAGLLGMGDTLQLLSDLIAGKGFSLKHRVARRFSRASHHYAKAVARVTGEKIAGINPLRALLKVYARVMNQIDVAGGRLELMALADILGRPIRICHFAAGDPESMRAVRLAVAGAVPAEACERRFLASADGILDDEMPSSFTPPRAPAGTVAVSAPEPRPRVQGRLVCEIYGWRHAGDPLEVFHESCGNREHVMLPVEGSVVPGRKFIKD